MTWNLRSSLVRSLALGLVVLAAPGLASAQNKTAPAPPALNVTVTAGVAPPPPVSITLHERHGHVTPHRGCLAHTGGGLIDVTSPSADVVIITMSGAVVANASMQFDLEQCFEVSFDDPKVKKAKLSIEGRVIGLLRAEPSGTAEYGEACAHVAAASVDLLSVCVPPHSVGGKHDSLSVNDHDGPKTGPVMPGKYTLTQTFSFSAHSKNPLMKHPSADFSPDGGQGPALDPLWISYFDPFHAVKKDSFGFQVTLRVTPDTDEANGEKKPTETRPMR
jgi:hypothetical protein